jgi:hypothetical protein
MIVRGALVGIKNPSTLQIEGDEIIPPSSCEPLEHSTHPIVTLVSSSILLSWT